MRCVCSFQLHSTWRLTLHVSQLQYMLLFFPHAPLRQLPEHFWQARKKTLSDRTGVLKLIVMSSYWALRVCRCCSSWQIKTRIWVQGLSDLSSLGLKIVWKSPTRQKREFVLKLISCRMFTSEFRTTLIRFADFFFFFVQSPLPSRLCYFTSNRSTCRPNN